MARGDGLYEVVRNVGENAYKIKLPRDMQIFATFNVGDLTSYSGDNEEHDEYLRINALQGGEVDAEQVPSLGILSLVRVFNHIGPILALCKGLGLTRLILTCDP